MTIGQDLTWWMDIEFSQMFTEENGKKNIVVVAAV